MAKQEIQGLDKQEVQFVSPTNQLSVVEQWNDALGELITKQKVELTPEEKTFGVSILTNLSNRCMTDKINLSDLRMTDFLEQVKHYAKLKLSIAEGEIYLDIRNITEERVTTRTDANGRSIQVKEKVPVGKQVRICRQYQGMQKLLMTYCSKKIVRFKDGIVYAGDEFSEIDDLDTGITRIIHKKNPTANRAQYGAITCAYAIAYVDELGDGKVVPYACIVPKRRIDRAKNAAKTGTVWTSDMERMVTKTAYWCLWGMLKPYIQFPSAIGESIVETEDEMDWDNHPADNEEQPTPEYDMELILDDTLKEPEKQMLPLPNSPSLGTPTLPTHIVEPVPQTTAEPMPNTTRIPWAMYTENRDKYEMVKGSYDNKDKTVAVTAKE